MTLAPGVRVGPYEILSLIGAGGMGEVFRARDTRLEREVALEVLSPRLTGQPESLFPRASSGPPDGGRAASGKVTPTCCGISRRS